MQTDWERPTNSDLCYTLIKTLFQFSMAKQSDNSFQNLAYGIYLLMTPIEKMNSPGLAQLDFAETVKLDSSVLHVCNNELQLWAEF